MQTSYVCPESHFARVNEDMCRENTNVNVYLIAQFDSGISIGEGLEWPACSGGGGGGERGRSGREGRRVRRDMVVGAGESRREKGSECIVTD